MKLLTNDVFYYVTLVEFRLNKNLIHIHVICWSCSCRQSNFRVHNTCKWSWDIYTIHGLWASITHKYSSLYTFGMLTVSRSMKLWHITTNSRTPARWLMSLVVLSLWNRGLRIKHGFEIFLVLFRVHVIFEWYFIQQSKVIKSRKCSEPEPCLFLGNRRARSTRGQSQRTSNFVSLCSLLFVRLNLPVPKWPTQDDDSC